MNKLILASSSVYRRALLDTLQLPYECISPDIDESARPGESAETLVRRLALEKAQAVARHTPNALVIGSDQVAVLDGDIIGKPLTHDKARAQLLRASGRSVRFVTGLCLLNSNSRHSQVDAIDFQVHFRTLTEQQINRYLEREQPYQCAGSFKSEGLGIALFERLEGDDPNSLIGLPLIRLVRMLENAGVQVL
ncbi:Maf family protein [Marinobacterium rhizophilum]|uniref:7-methyl-GTP pyrophosphatase n=1 Tax=Marinobacterium rhizophilum TaxID=420402 RepID=A0ABY5HQM6_9GAMM|nr:nucleoside triphosphate pyrophosphatase [Marinobacterium rhizophilum]UTW13519.1 septum formation inhibitor Maf [Marinobacterium rhizophilum]